MGQKAFPGHMAFEERHCHGLADVDILQEDNELDALV
jgi:hypothetical protein